MPRTVRIAAAGDFHYEPESDNPTIRGLLAAIRADADIFVLCGDMTTHGEPEQMRGFVGLLADLDIPIVAVLGNHDHEAGRGAECMAILRDRGIHVLDGNGIVIDGIGFAGVKGFGGGFGRGALSPFGEPEWKAVVDAAVAESLKLETALRDLRTDTKVVVLHYAPIAETLLGEPETLFPFLGSSRLLPPIDTLGASVVFHGHAHIGVAEAQTPAGVPVFNVAVPILRRDGRGPRIWRTFAPDRQTES